MKDLKIFLKKVKQKKRKKTLERYQTFTEKEKKASVYWKCNKIFSKEQKQKLVEYRKNYYITHNK